MPENQKDDPLIRAMVIVVVGTIAFGLLFNLLKGGDNMDHMGNMSGYGYSSLDSILGGLLILLVKLLMVVLVIAVVVGVVMWIKNAFFKNTNSQFMQTVNNDPILKTIAVVTLSIIGIVLLFGLLGSFTNSGMGYGGYMNGSMGGFNTTYSISGLLTLLIKVLSFVLVISLILALAAYLKKQYDAGAFNFAKNNAQVTNTGTANIGNNADNSGQDL